MSVTPRPPAAPAGLTVGGYQLLTRLGEGGMGVVHLARSPSGERIALKVLRPGVVGDDESRARLAREVNSLLRVRSRRVAEIIDADPWGDVPFVATRYVPGYSLHDQIAQEGPLEGDDLVWFARNLVRAVGVVHAAGVVHRDIKPSNILMEGRTPVLIDFGLARLADDPRLTAQGWLLGTPGYLAPEILHGEDASPASDLHSWAATVAYAGTGRAPFGSGPSAAVMDRVRRGEHDLSGLPEEVAEVVRAGLDPEPRNRPTVAAVLAWLDPGETWRDDDEEAIDEELDEPTVRIPLEPFPVTRPLTEHPTTVLPVTSVLDDSDPWEARHWPQEGWPAEDDQVDDWRGETTLVDEAPDGWARPDDGWEPAEPSGDPERDDVELVDDPWATPEEAPPPKVGLVVRSRRALLLLLLAAGVALWFAAAPWPAFVVLTVVVWCLRTLSHTASAAAERRRLRGARWYDGVQSVAAAPVHVFSSLPGTLGLLLWASGVGAVAGLLLFTVVAPVEAILGGVGAGFALGLWWGPGSTRLRRTVGPLVRPFAAHWVVWLVVTCAATVGLVAAVAQLSGEPVLDPTGGRWSEGILP